MWCEGCAFDGNCAVREFVAMEERGGSCCEQTRSQHFNTQSGVCRMRLDLIVVPGVEDLMAEVDRRSRRDGKMYVAVLDPAGTSRILPRDNVSTARCVASSLISGDPALLAGRLKDAA